MCASACAPTDERTCMPRMRASLVRRHARMHTRACTHRHARAAWTQVRSACQCQPHSLCWHRTCHMCAWARACACVHACVHVRVHMCMRECTHALVRACFCAFAHARACACMRTFSGRSTLACRMSPQLRRSTPPLTLHAPPACAHVRAHAFRTLHACEHACETAFMCAFMRVHMRARMRNCVLYV